jgi:hypothetical protein
MNLKNHLLRKAGPCFLNTAAILVLLLWSVSSMGQTIHGTVFDKKTRVPIEFASIYFNGTITGTYSAQDGSFELDISKNQSMPLTVSAIGYNTTTLADYSPDRPVLVFLDPKVYELDEIVVTAKIPQGERKVNLRTFRDEFLGNTGNALTCEIENEADIGFNYGKDRDTLKAYARKPIIIHNKALGYTITYFLDKFEYYRESKSFFFKGTIMFKEDAISDASRKESVERRRQNTYLGSRMHFFRVLWSNQIEQSGFVVRTGDNQIINPRLLVVQDQNRRKYLSYPEPVGICYYSKTPKSRLIFLKDKVFFDNRGYYDPTGITWEGDMARSRIADWLPFEYSFGL